MTCLILVDVFFSDFAKDNDYTVSIVDSLLDLLTGGDHSKTKKILEEKKRLREEEEAIKTMLEVKPVDNVKIDIEELKSLQSKLQEVFLGALQIRSAVQVFSA